MCKITTFLSAGLMLGGLCFGGALTALGETTPPSQTRQVMAENHKKAAEMHAKMAACLASDKTVEQCREDMAASCGTTFGANCPMGGGMRGQGKGRGMMGGGPCMGWMLDPGAPPLDAAPNVPSKK